MKGVGLLLALLLGLLVLGMVLTLIYGKAHSRHGYGSNMPVSPSAGVVNGIFHLARQVKN